MALKIAKDSGLTDVVGAGNPVSTTHPISGSAEVVQLWLYNDDATKRYETITIDPTDSTDTDESTWVELSSDGITYGAAGVALSMSDISDNGVGYTFYARITTPAVGDTQNKTDITIDVAAREYAV